MLKRRSISRLVGMAVLAGAVFSFIGLILSHGLASATPTCTDSWMGSASGSTGTAWFTKANWSTGAVPTATDYVCMAASPVNTTPTINSGQTASASGINFPTSGDITVNGQLNLGTDGSTIDTLDVPGTLQINGAGPVSVGDFTLDGSETGTLKATGTNPTLTVIGTGNLTSSPNINNGIKLVVSGTTTVATGTFYMYTSSSIEVASGGTLDMADSAYLYPADGSTTTATVDSGGTIDYNASTSSDEAYVEVPIALDGDAVANHGKLEIEDGGSIGATASATGTNGGMVVIASEINEPSGVTGDIAGLTLSGGTYAGPGKYAVPSGTTTYISGGDLSATTLTNNGTIDLASQQTDYMYSSSVIDNFGTISFTDGADLYNEDSTADLLNNESTGTLAYAGTTTSSDASIEVALDDDGTAAVTRGVLQIDDSAFVGPGQKTTGAGQFALEGGTIAPESANKSTPGVISGIVPEGGQWSGPGELLIPTGQSASWANGSIGAGADVVNDGTLTLAASYTLYMYNTSTIENAGSIVLGDSSDIYDEDSSGNLLLNDTTGSITFHATSSAEDAYINIPFTNEGSVSASYGQLQLQGTTIVDPTAVATSSNGGHVVVTGTVQPPPPVKGKPQSGSVDGLELDGTATGPGTLTVPTGTTFAITGGTITDVIIANSGTTTMESGDSVNMSNTSQVQNFGTFVDQDDTTIYDADSTGNEVVNETTGTLNYVGTNATQTSDIEPPILNEGTLGVNEGTFQVILMSSTLAGTTTGTLKTGTYNLSGTLDVSETAQISGGTTSTQSSPNLVVNDASLTIGSAGDFETNSGDLTSLTTNDGTFVSSKTVTLLGRLSSSGVLSVAKGILGVPGGVTLSGGSVTTVDSGATLESGSTSKPGAVTLAVPGTGLALPELTGTGTIEGDVINGGGNVQPSVGAAGSEKVSGTFSETPATGGSPELSIGVEANGTAAGTDFGQLAVTGAATLGGTLAFTPAAGYTPANGTSFTILTAKSISGTFSKITGSEIAGKFLNVSYTATSVIVTVTPPFLKTVTPAAVGQAATSAPVSLTGLGFATGDTLSSANTGVTFSHFKAVSTTTATAEVSVTASAATGSTSVIVKPTTGTAFSCASCLKIDAKPTISKLSPNTLGTGSTSKPVTVTGSGFTSSSGHPLTVSITGPGTGVTAKVTGTVSASSLTVDVTVPAATKTGKYSVSILNGDYGVGGCSSCLTIEVVPTVTGFSPPKVVEGASGVAVTITGTNFETGAVVSSSNTGVTFSSVAVKSATQITAKVSVKSNAATGAVNVTVADPGQGQGTEQKAFTIDAPPAPKSLSPNSLAQGTSKKTVTLSGTGFAAGAKVSITGTGAGSAITVVVGKITATAITLTVSVAKTAPIEKYSVTVTNTDGGKGTCTNCLSVVKA